jgi:multiple sugar transport system ATP-binding protein
VAGFIGSPPMNFFPGTLSNKGGGLFFETDAAAFDTTRIRLRVDDETAPHLASFAGKNVLLGIRPEHIADNPANTEDGHSVDAVTETVEPMGAETNIFAVSGGHSFAVRLHGARSAVLQKKISLVFDMRRAHFFDPATERAIGA